MQIILLGTGAPLTPDRATTGLLVTAPGCQPLLVDTCGGFELPRQLAAAGVPQLHGIRNVVVTHRHLDHAGGIQALYLASRPLDVHALADTHDGIAQMTAGCFPEWQRHPDVRHHEARPGDCRDIGGFEVSFFEARHRVPTVAVRIRQGGKTFAFSADTVPCGTVVECARHADLFVCDAICAEADGEASAKRARDLMHPTAREAAVMAREAGAGRLVCTHIGRFGTPSNIEAEARAAFGGDVVVPADLARLDV